MNNSICASCPFSKSDRLCTGGETGVRHPDACITATGSEILSRAMAEYDKPDIHEFALQAGRQAASGFVPDPEDPNVRRCVKPRIQETAEFCVRCGYKRIGLAFCGAVHKDAALLEKVLRSYGLEVVSAMCKIGGVTKDTLGLSAEEQVHRGKQAEVMCNPIAQAMVLNDAKTDFNLVMGLCVGHDALFLKYSEAMCTVVAVKDRVLAHNPLAALHCSSYEYLFKK